MPRKRRNPPKEVNFNWPASARHCDVTRCGRRRWRRVVQLFRSGNAGQPTLVKLTVRRLIGAVVERLRLDSVGADQSWRFEFGAKIWGKSNGRSQSRSQSAVQMSEDPVVTRSQVEEVFDTWRHSARRFSGLEAQAERRRFKSDSGLGDAGGGSSPIRLNQPKVYWSKDRPKNHGQKVSHFVYAFFFQNSKFKFWRPKKKAEAAEANPRQGHARRGDQRPLAAGAGREIEIAAFISVQTSGDVHHSADHRQSDQRPTPLRQRRPADDRVPQSATSAQFHAFEPTQTKRIVDQQPVPGQRPSAVSGAVPAD